MNILVSVIIPVYNCERTLENCLASIFDTDYSDFEVIVIDDYSKDNSLSIASKFPCKIIRLDANCGPAAARMAGCRIAKGKYLAFTDGDCIVEKEWIRKIACEISLIQKNNKDVIAVTGRVLPKPAFIERCEAYNLYGYYQHGKMRDIDTLCTSNAIVDKEIFDKAGGFDERLKKEEDRELALKIIRNGYKIFFSPSIYVIHDHARKTFAEFLIYNYNVGKKIGLELELKYKDIRRIPYPKGIDNPYIYALLVPLISAAIANRIFWANIRYDKKIILYLPFIYLAKLFWRYGAVNWLWQEKRKPDIQEWKIKDRKYHEDKAVVESYDNRITKKYYIEHKYFTLNKWIGKLKDLDKRLVLDFGCGTGTATLRLLGSGIKTISLDASSAMLRMLQKKAGLENIECTCVEGDVENLPFKNGTFDGIICMGVLHHLPDIEKGIKNQIRVLKKDGLLFMSGPFIHKPWFSYLYYFPLNVLKFIRNIILGPRPDTKERPLAKSDLESILKILKENNLEYKLNYLVYWPLVCGNLAESIALPLARFLNKINLHKNRGDIVIVTAEGI